MDRRTFVQVAGLAALGVARSTRAQRTDLPRIGVLAPNASTLPLVAVIEGLRDLGYRDGKSVRIDVRAADGDFARLPALAADLVRTKPDVIVSVVTQATLAAKDATSTIPIVMVAVNDPVAAGIVGNLARPGGNVTGTAILFHAAIAKQVEIVRQLVPKARRIDVLWNPANVVYQQQMLGEALIAASRNRIVANLVAVRSREELEHALGGGSERPDAMLILTDPLFSPMAARIAELALARQVPAISAWRIFPEAGALASYGPDFQVMAKRAATYVHKILRGARPGDLAIEQPTRFELVVNARTADALGLAIPRDLLARADEVLR
ncbi:MAG: ABC transporter substrate-binding protein [Burkholderiales bacterium]